MYLASIQVYYFTIGSIKNLIYCEWFKYSNSWLICCFFFSLSYWNSNIDVTEFSVHERSYQVAGDSVILTSDNAKYEEPGDSTNSSSSDEEEFSNGYVNGCIAWNDLIFVSVS